MTSRKTASRPVRWRRVLSWFAGVTTALALAVYLTRGFWFTTLRAYFIGRTYLASEEFGPRLSVVDEVEILALGGEVAVGTTDSFSPDIGPPTGTVARRTVRGAEAEAIASLWRDIRFDQSFAALCHQPHYALRFRSHGKLVFETSVCWKCSTYSLPVGIFGHTLYGFDAKSDQAQKLLSTLTQYAPHPATPQ